MARHVPADRAQAAGKLTQILMPILKGSNIIVTGASRGLGLAIALELARNGAGLFLVADGRWTVFNAQPASASRQVRRERSGSCKPTSGSAIPPKTW